MRQLDYILTQLAQTFVARDLMVPRGQLVCGADLKTAQQKLSEFPKYDIVPIKQKERLTAFVERGEEAVKTIYPQHLISDATSVFDLVDLFQSRKFYFVVEGNDVAGFIHFADLNNRLVKLPYYVILETVEGTLLRAIGGRLTEEIIQEVVTPEQWKRLQQKHKRLRSQDADIGYTNLLQFSFVIDIAMYLDCIQLSTAKRDALINVRNRVSHGTDPLVENYDHVRRLADAKKTAFDLLDHLKGI